jgi:RNA polymerase sigma-70 factor (ECF subfamily)
MATNGSDPTGRTDAQLVAAVASGDEVAFRALYRRHSPRLRALIVRVLGGHQADGDDALQDTWVRAIARLPTFKGHSTLITWLSGIGINVSLELMRRRRPGAIDALQDEPHAPGSDMSERMDLEQALARLPDPQRIVVVLHDVEGYTHEEIARRLGVAEATSRSHLFRARRSLRAMLDSYERIPE